MASVAAIIPTYNRRALLLECLDSLFRQTVPLTRIIVVDNASTDGTVEAVRARYPSHPAIEIHRLDRNTGASGGFHAATKIAFDGGYDWIWYTDNDSEPEPDALEKLLTAAADLGSKGNTVAGLASLKIDTRGRIQASHNGRFTWRQIPVPEKRCRGIVPIEYGAFTGLLVSRDAIARAGSVNPDYFIWCDDLDLCLRIGKAGGLFLIADSRVLHKDIVTDRSERFELGNFWRYYFGTRNWLHTAIVHRGWWAVPPILAACLFRIATVWVGMNRKVLRTRLLLKGIRDGLVGNFSDPVTPGRWRRILDGEPLRRATAPPRSKTNDRAPPANLSP
ncbi:MAG: glycosyltransferase [Desulfobacteria bacterium]|nr:glycosyltransferase [Deltaproteobacteria bacterium]